jgi:octaprenyl-diphosphate synthase
LSQVSAALKDIYEPIQGEIDRVEEVLRQELAHDNPFVGQLLEHSTRFQGKRIRPALLLHCAHVLGGVTDLHIALGAAVEMIHNATLIHDDVLDEAHLRRQEKTLNHRWGNEASILFGDYLFARAYALCARIHNREANLILARTVEEMCVGELSQIALKFNFDIDEEQYHRVIRLKTASLFATACRLGGVGHRADPAAVEALSHYGTCIGTAFQIVDDCLDLTGDEREVGKSLGTDLEKGKLTLPVIQLLRQLSPGERQAVENLLAGRNGPADKRTEVLRLIRERDLIRQSLARAAALVEDGKNSLRKVPDSLYMGNLVSLADFVLQRRA